MSDFTYSIGFKTDESGLQTLQKAFDKLDKEISKTQRSIESMNKKGQDTSALQKTLGDQYKKLELVTKAFGELDTALKKAAQAGINLESKQVQVNQTHLKTATILKDLVSLTEKHAAAMNKDAAAVQGMISPELLAFMNGMQKSFNGLTESIEKQTNAYNKNAEAQKKAQEERRKQIQENIKNRQQQQPEEEPTPMPGAGFTNRAFATAKQALLTAPIYQAAYTVTGGIQNTINDYIKLDTVLNRIAIVTGQTTDNVRAMKEEFSAAARTLGTSTEEYAKGIETFLAQGGRAADNAKDLATASIQLANATGQSADDTSQYVTAIGNSFKLIDKGQPGIQKIADTLLYLDNASATSADEIGKAMQRSASSFESAGVEYDRAAAMIAVSSEVTRLAPERVGTAFKTIIENIQTVNKQGPKEIKDFSNKIQQTIEDFPSLKDKLKLFDETGTQMVPMTEFLTQLQDTFATIGKTDPMAANALAQAIGGKENANVLSALLENYDRFQELFSGAKNDSLGAAAKAQEEKMNSLQSKINVMKQAWEEFTNKLISSGAITNFLESLTKVIDAINGALGESHQLLKIIGLLVSVYLIKNFKDFDKFFRGTGDNIKSIGTRLGEVIALARGGIPFSTKNIITEAKAAEKALKDLEVEMKRVELQKSISSSEKVLGRKNLKDETRKKHEENLAENKRQLSELQAQEIEYTKKIEAGKIAAAEAAAKGSLMSRAGGFLKAGAKTIGKAGIPGMLASGALTIGIDKLSGDERSIADIAKDEAGSMIGGGLGLAIGTLVAGPVGAFVGQMIGSWVGSNVQEWIGKEGKERAAKQKELDDRFVQNAETYKKLELKKQQGIELTTQEKNAYDSVTYALGGYTKQLNGSILAIQNAISAKKDLAKAEKEYLSALSDGAVDATGKLDSLLNARDKVNFAEQISLLSSGKDSFKGPNYTVTPEGSGISKRDELSNRIQQARSSADVEKILTDFPDVYKESKDKITALTIKTDDYMNAISANATTILEHASEFNRKQKENILLEFGKGKKGDKNFGLLNDLNVDLSKLTDEKFNQVFDLVLKAAQAEGTLFGPEGPYLKVAKEIANIAPGIEPPSSQELKSAMGELEKILPGLTDDLVAFFRGSKDNLDNLSSTIKAAIVVLNQGIGTIDLQLSGYSESYLTNPTDSPPTNASDLANYYKYGRKSPQALKDAREKLLEQLDQQNKILNSLPAQSATLGKPGYENIVNAFKTAINKILTGKDIKKTTGDTTGGDYSGLDPLIDLLKKEEIDPGAEVNRILKLLDIRIQNIKDGNGTTQEKLEELKKRYEYRTSLLKRAKDIYKKALMDSKKELLGIVKADAEVLGKVNLKEAGDGYFTEGSIAAVKSKLEDNVISLQKKLQGMGKRVEADATKKIAGNAKSYDLMQRSVENAQKALDAFNTSVGQYENNANKSIEATDKLTDAIRAQSDELVSLQSEILKQDINEKLFGQPAIDKIQNYFDTLSSYQEEYANSLEKTISLSQLQNKLDQDRIKYGATNQFTDFQKKITSLKKDGKQYSQEELKLLTSEYDLMLKQVMLKRAEQGSQETRLMRDAAGNWVYGAASGANSRAADVASARGDLLSSAAAFMEDARKATVSTSSKMLALVNKMTENDVEIMKARAIIESPNASVTTKERELSKQSLQTLYGIDVTLKQQLAAEQNTLGREAETYKKAAIAAGVAATDDPLLSGFIDKVLNASTDEIKNVFGKELPADLKKSIQVSIDQVGNIVNAIGATLSNLTVDLEPLKTTAVTINGQLTTAGDALSSAIGDVSKSLKDKDNNSLWKSITDAVTAINGEIKKLLDKAGAATVNPTPAAPEYKKGDKRADGNIWDGENWITPDEWKKKNAPEVEKLNTVLNKVNNNTATTTDLLSVESGPIDPKQAVKIIEDKLVDLGAKIPEPVPTHYAPPILKTPTPTPKFVPGSASFVVGSEVLAQPAATKMFEIDPKVKAKAEAKAAAEKRLSSAQAAVDSAQAELDRANSKLSEYEKSKNVTAAALAKKYINNTASPNYNTAALELVRAKVALSSLDTGGYTGDFSGGALAVLHSKELVLNKQDTKNILDAVAINRKMASSFASNPSSAAQGIPKNETSNNTIINASFPNVSSSEEIRKAFANMSNSASQFAYRMRPGYGT